RHRLKRSRVCSAPLRAALRPGHASEMHFGETNPTGILAKRSQGSFGVVLAKAGTHDHRRWLWVPALPSLSRGSAGTTAGSLSSTNLRLCEMMAGAAALFRACYLQGMVQLQRVGPREGPLWHHPRKLTIRRHNVF